MITTIKIMNISIIFRNSLSPILPDVIPRLLLKKQKCIK